MSPRRTPQTHEKLHPTKNERDLSVLACSVQDNAYKEVEYKQLQWQRVRSQDSSYVIKMWRTNYNEGRLPDQSVGK